MTILIGRHLTIASAIKSSGHYLTQAVLASTS
jgi:hypothetical protein